MQQLRSQNLRFDDCRIAHSIDKKSFDKVHMLNLSSLIAKSNFFKKLLERSLYYILLFKLFIYFTHFIQSLNMNVFQFYKQVHDKTINKVIRHDNDKFDRLKFLIVL